VVVGVAYGTDMNLALGAIQEILRSNPRVLQDPAPGIGVARLGDSRINININPWVNLPDYNAAVSEINKAILATFPGRNIAMPLPQLEVRMLDGAA
jgi:small conductance mechanosensitive channel